MEIRHTPSHTVTHKGVCMVPVQIKKKKSSWKASHLVVGLFGEKFEQHSD